MVEDRAIGDPFAGAAKAKPRFSVSKAISFLTGSRKVLRYFFAARRKFASPDFLSIAINASRVARKKVSLTVMAKPDNVAMWAPPQAGSVHCVYGIWS